MSEAELTGMTEAMAREGELGSGCAMYGQSPLGKPYVANGAAPQALPEKSAKKLQSVCPSVYAANGGPQGLWCCDPSQVDLLATKKGAHEVVRGGGSRRAESEHDAGGQDPEEARGLRRTVRL